MKLILPGFPTTYFPEQGFCQVLHTRNKYRDRLDMNKIGDTLFKLMNLQPALKKLADKHHRKVRMSWNELFLEINNIYSTNAFVFVLFCANQIARLFFIIWELFSKQNTIFRKIIETGAIFKNCACTGANLQKKVENHWLKRS